MSLGRSVLCTDAPALEVLPDNRANHDKDTYAGPPALAMVSGDRLTTPASEKDAH